MSDRYESHMEMMARHDRAERCMAACAGIAEPEKAIPALVEALRALLAGWEYNNSFNGDLDNEGVVKARAALALVQPPPTVQAAKSTPILDAIKTVRERELHRAAQAEAAMANDPDLEGHIEEEEP